MMLVMEPILQRCCGIDVHKKTILACLMVGTADEKPHQTIKTFSAMTRDLLAFKDWLESEHCTCVAMESSGVYWESVFNILEESMEVILANARHIKHVPGRKTDVKDCEWIAQLLRHGLIAGNFIPPRPIWELRDLTHYRRKLIQAKSSELNRVHKVPEDGNIKLSSVVSDINGLSSQDMIYHLMKEDMSPQQMAELARGRLRKKTTELEKALEGSLREHHRLILRVSIQMIASYDTAIAKLDGEIEQRRQPYRDQSERLQSIPGVKKRPLNH
jgi:transposase